MSKDSGQSDWASVILCKDDINFQGDNQRNTQIWALWKKGQMEAFSLMKYVNKLGEEIT